MVTLYDRVLNRLFCVGLAGGALPDRGFPALDCQIGEVRRAMFRAFGPFSTGACPVELQQVVGGAYQSPLAAYFLYAAQQELPEALRLLDLTEDRLDDCFSSSIDRSSCLGCKFAFHSVDQVGRFW